MKKFIKTFFLVLFINSAFLFFANSIQAQVQGPSFEGNTKDSYQCFNPTTGESEEPSDVKDFRGYWLCFCNDASRSAPNPDTFKCGPAGDTCDKDEGPGDPGCFAEQSVPKPPTLQQLEIWFVRIVYAIWALVGSFSFFFLVVLGYRYLISRGDVTKITEIRQKIIYYIIGFVLIFLAVPILTTFFNLLGVNEDFDCYNVEMPGFQFFFTDLCTDAGGAALDDPCSAPGSAVGLLCNPGSGQVTCNISGLNLQACYVCRENNSSGDTFYTWQRDFGPGCQ